MNPAVIGQALAAACGIALAGAAGGALLPRPARIPAAGLATAAAGAAGTLAGAAALSGARWTADLPWLLPLSGGVRLEVDALSGLFMAVSGAVAVAAGVYGIGYAGRRADAEPPGAAGPRGHAHALGCRTAQSALPLFVLTLLLVPAAGSVPALLLFWELMALTSLPLVLAEHRHRPAVREAGLWYAVMAQLGFVLLLAALALYAAYGGGGFDALRDARPPQGVRTAVFLLAAAGFGSKAGLVPLHPWLPRAHAEAPGPVSALMSAAMVGLGAYGIIRVGFDLLGGGPRWWWWTLIGAGAVSALYGILQAAMASDLKRLLAHSTSENTGLVLVGTGASGLFRAAGNAPLAGLALAAALLHVVNHAAFKALLFSAAGAVVRATGGVRDLDRLGGLRARMPATAGLFAVAALGATALPPGNGFVSEWLLLQALIHGPAVHGVSAAVLLPVAVAAVALSAGLAAAVFVKALGVGFFARPRGDGAARARECTPAMLAAMGALATACAALAVAPGALGPALSRACAAAGVRGAGSPTGAGLSVRLARVSAASAPVWVVCALAAGMAGAVALTRLAARRRTGRRPARPWDCGGGPPTPRNAYTATSFGEPLQRVFRGVLAPTQVVEVLPVRGASPEAGYAYLVDRVRFHRRVPDRIEHHLYGPLLAGLHRAGLASRRLAGGSIHLYLGYGFLGLTAVLLTLTALG